MTIAGRVLVDRLHVWTWRKEELCVLCGEEEESGSHFFFECKVAWKVWCICNKWVGEVIVYHWDARSHFAQFYLGWTSQRINSYWGCMWIVVVGEIWKQRNLVIFENGRIDYYEIFTLTKLKAWSWLTSKVKDVSFTYVQWCMDPKTCLKTIKK